MSTLARRGHLQSKTWAKKLRLYWHQPGWGRRRRSASSEWTRRSSRSRRWTATRSQTIDTKYEATKEDSRTKLYKNIFSLNEAPSDVNKSLDGWTYPRWKMTPISHQNFFLVSAIRNRLSSATSSATSRWWSLIRSTIEFKHSDGFKTVAWLEADNQNA